MKCDIIIPIWNNLEYTRECIKSIEKNTAYPYRLILIDNASDRDTAGYLSNLVKTMNATGRAKAVLIRNETNTGFVKAVNQGLKVSDAPYVCIFNNDTLPAPGWLERMVEFAQTHKDVGLINPLCDGHGTMSIDLYAKRVEKNKGKFMEMNQCQGFCMLVKRELINAIGYLDEAFGIGGYDDTDYSIRAHRAGYRCVAIHDAYVYHRQHASFNKAGNREEWVQRNQKIYYDKWGKHLRMGVAVHLAEGEVEKLASVMHLVYGLAREWSWVHLWINSGLDMDRIRKAVEKICTDADLPPHQNIRIDYFNMPRWLMSLTVCAKFIERLRKRMAAKRFDAVVVFDRALGEPALMCAKLVKASVLNFSWTEEFEDWQKKGSQTALYIKQKRKEYE